MLTAILAFVGVLLATLSVAAWVTTWRRRKVATVLDTAIVSQVRQVPGETTGFRKLDALSAIPWLDHMLRRLEIIPRLTALLGQADVKWTPGTVILLTVCSYLFPAYVVYLRFHTLWAGLFGVLPATIPLGYIAVLRSRRLSKCEAGLAEALDLIVGALRVGQSLNNAFAALARECPDPLGSEFRILVKERNFGLDIRAALQNLVRRVPLQDLKMAVTAILIHYESGGNLAEVLDKTAQIIRQRLRLKKQIQVYTAQGRLTGWILSILPIVLGIALYFLSPGTTSLLWTRSLGIKLLVGAACGVVLGCLAIQKIVRIDV